MEERNYIRDGTRRGKLIVEVCYRPPNLKEEEEFDLLSRLKIAVRQKNVFVMGDFNYPDIDWPEGTTHSLNFMYQFVDSQIRNDALLDLLI